jgi:hypothetical protein
VSWFRSHGQMTTALPSARAGEASALITLEAVSAAANGNSGVTLRDSGGWVR